MSLRHGFRIPLATLLVLAAALLVSCGSSSDKLIPVASSGPLQSDFEMVAQDAEAGNGNCAATESAILKTEQDFDALPAALDSGLRETLRQGIQNLRARALALCVQPLVQTTPTTTIPKTTTSTATTPPPTTTTTTTTTGATTPTTPTTTTPGGGTPAPGVGETPDGGGGQGGGTGVGENGSANGANPAEGGAGAGSSGANGQEAAK
jgi:hypothetical protein